MTGRVVIQTGDACAMSFADEGFDLVVSTLCLHNIDGPERQGAALREIARALRPGGVALLSGLAHTDRYAAVLGELGLGVTRHGPLVATFPPQRLVQARKRARVADVG